ncbi:MAG: PHP domain-containing protein [Clostridiaceae bacterium]|nr:PHP domain-containing protein [Clostridiaceae bacterium]
MYCHEKTYDLDLLARMNLHVHTAFSRCADRAMTLPAIVEEAEKAGLDAIALVDHHNNDLDDDIILAHVQDLRNQLAGLDTQIRVLIGCELSCYGIGKTLEGAKVRQALDYRAYALNHYHMPFWAQPDKPSPRGYACHMLAMARSLIVTGRADCLVHPLDAGYARNRIGPEGVRQANAAITDREMGELFELALRHEVAIELNVSGILAADKPQLRRIYDIGRETGVWFSYGNDAHHLPDIATRPALARVKACLQDRPP